MPAKYEEQKEDNVTGMSGQWEGLLEKQPERKQTPHQPDCVGAMEATLRNVGLQWVKYKVLKHKWHVLTYDLKGLPVYSVQNDLEGHKVTLSDNTKIGWPRSRQCQGSRERRSDVRSQMLDTLWTSVEMN